jgi:integrase
LPNEKKKLSSSVADGAKARAGRYFIWDTELVGFALRVNPTGTRTWVVKYRSEGGGRNAPVRWHRVGAFPALSGQEARKAAKKLLAKVELGEDPMGDLAAKRREMTVSTLVDLYEEEGCVVQRGCRIGTPMKSLTKQYTMARLRHHVIPLLGKRKISEVTGGDVESFAKQVTSGATAKDEKVGPRKRIIVRGGAGAARKVVRDLSAVFEFALRRTLVPNNPVLHASVRKSDNRRERFLDLEEVKRLGAALDELEREGVNPKAVNIARLWALTGCRRNEIAGLRWSEVDLEAGMLILQDSKTGASRRPLGAAAVALLDSLRDADDVRPEFVFPAERGTGFYQGTKRVWAEAIKRADLPGVTPHVLRHTLGSAAASSGEALLMVGSLLGHKNARSTQIYAHITHDPARLAADRVSAPLAIALGVQATPPQRSLKAA